MDDEIKEYLIGVSKLLNGQLRGVLNKKAREENLELIQLTMGDVFEKALGLGKSIRVNENNIDKLRIELGIKTKDHDDQGS